MTIKNIPVKYNNMAFGGAGLGYGSQGICSVCKWMGAKWMQQRGICLWAYCDRCLPKKYGYLLEKT